MTGIKICGLFRNCDIDYVNEAGPDYAGFIINYPRSHRSVTPERAAELRRRLRPQIRAVGVFVDRPLSEVVTAAEEIPLDVIQLHGSEDNDYICALREETGLPVWKAFRIRERKDLAAAKISCADTVLLDNGTGTGQSFDWSCLADMERSFILAGGLTPERIPDAAAIPGVRVLDISSGVETDRVKDREKILRAVKAARGQ